MRRRGLLAGVLASVLLVWAALLPNVATAVVGSSRASLIATKSNIDPDALAWQAAVVTAGGTVSGSQLANVSALIAGEKTDGVWAVLDWQFLHAAENVQQATIDLKTRAAATLVNSPTFTARSGITTDGSSSYVQLLVPGSNYTLNSASFGWFQNTSLSQVNGTQMGSFQFGGGSRAIIWAAFTDGNAYSGVNDLDADSGGATPGTTTGLWIADRDSSTTNALYRANGLVETANQTSNAVVDQTFYLGGTHGTANDFSRPAPANGAMSFCGGHLSSTLRAALGTRFSTYLAGL
jgi:hypothetical protein